MNSVNDSKLYKWFVIVTFAVGVILGAVSFYSILHVEPKITKLLDAGSAVAVPENADEAAGILEREPVSLIITAMELEGKVVYVLVTNVSDYGPKWLTMADNGFEPFITLHADDAVLYKHN